MVNFRITWTSRLTRSLAPTKGVPIDYKAYDGITTKNRRGTETSPTNF